MQSIKTLIIGTAAVMPLFLTSFIPNNQNEYLANRFAAPAAERKCADTSWTWYNNRLPEMGNIATVQRTAFCRHTAKISSPTFNPKSVMERL